MYCSCKWLQDNINIGPKMIDGNENEQEIYEFYYPVYWGNHSSNL